MSYEDNPELLIDPDLQGYSPVDEAEKVLWWSRHPWLYASRRAAKRLLEEMASTGEFYSQNDFLQLPPG